MQVLSMLPWRWLAALFVCSTTLIAGAADVRPVPALNTHVTDEINLLPPERKAVLESRLVGLEQQKGVQIAVLLIDSTKGEAIEAYALRVVEAWRLGRKGVDDGLLLIVAKDDRRMRIEVGRGLEGTVPDAIAKRIVAEKIAPLFGNGDFPGGIEAGVDALLAAISGEPLPPPSSHGVTLSSGSDHKADEWLVLGLVGTLLAGGILRLIFGRLISAILVGGLVGGGVWLLTSILSVALAGGGLAFIFALVVGVGSAGRSIGRSWPMGGFGHGGGSGGWSGGGGSFGGGGASGSW